MYKVMKIYYDKVTGERIWDSSYSYNASIDFDADYKAVKDLNSRVKESIGLLVLTDNQYAQDFLEGGRIVGVDLIKNTPLFEYPNPSEPEEPVIPLTTRVEDVENQSIDTMMALTEVYTDTIDRESENVDTMIALTEVYDYIMILEQKILELERKGTV